LKQYWLKDLCGIEKGIFYPFIRCRGSKKKYSAVKNISEDVKEGAFGKLATARAFWSEQ